MMKKLSAIALILLMLCGIALAEGGSTPKDEPASSNSDGEPLSMEYPEDGFTLHFPAEFKTLKGMLIPTGGLEISPGVSITMINYLGMAEEDLLSLKNGNDDEAYSDALNKAIQPLCILLVLKDNQDIETFIQSFVDSQEEADDIKVLAKAGGTTFCSIATSPDQPLEPGFQEEYDKIRGMIDDVLANADYYEPINVYAGTENRALSFDTTDMDGNAVSSTALFAEHEYTLVNIWASWCGPCINELEELQTIDGRLSEVDCGVVGLLYDGNEEAPRETARAILEEKGISYTVILAPENVDEQFVVQAFPTTYIVNRQGVIVGDPIIGARVDQYEPAITALLEK